MPATASFTFAPTAPASPAVSLRDDTFDPAHPEAYQLAVWLGGGRCCLAAQEVARQKIVLLEDLALPTPAELPALAAQHELLSRQGWARVRVAVAGSAFTLLPAPLFRAGDEAAYLQLHHALAPTEQAVAYALPPASPAHELVSLFAASTALLSWLRTTHGPEARLVHHTSALLAGLLYQQGPTAPPRQLSLHMAGTELTLLVLGTQLEFCNVFAVSTPEDIVYYTILTMQELGLNPDQDALTVWGELTSDSAAFALLGTYVRHLRFGNRPFGLHYSYRLNEVAEHRYFELFSLTFCG